MERGPAVNPLFTAFFAAVQEAGYPLTDDVNGYKQEGFAAFDRNIYRGHRLSAARAYLHPVEDRPNLEVRTRAFVTKINFAGKRAVGCDVVHNRRKETIEAGEVLLCGGAINSPQLLQLSGVGRGSELRSLGVDVVEDVPAVGENLQDHLEVYIQYSSKQPVSVAPALKWRNRPWVGTAWLLGRRGPGATNHFEGGGFIRSNEDVAYPNLMYHFLPVAIRYDGTAPQGHGYQVHVGPMYSDARGTIKIKSTDPKEHPAIQFNYLSTKTDRREWIEAVRISRNILNQPAFDAYNGGELSPGPSVETDQEILDWVAKDSETALHPSCTCRLGTGEDAVIDPTVDAGPRPGGHPGRRRLLDALRHQRQHLRADDDAGREERRHDPGQHAAGPDQRAVLRAPDGRGLGGSIWPRRGRHGHRWGRGRGGGGRRRTGRDSSGGVAALSTFVPGFAAAWAGPRGAYCGWKGSDSGRCSGIRVVS